MKCQSSLPDSHKIFRPIAQLPMLVSVATSTSLHLSRTGMVLFARRLFWPTVVLSSRLQSRYLAGTRFSRCGRGERYVTGGGHSWTICTFSDSTASGSQLWTFDSSGCNKPISHISSGATSTSASGSAPGSVFVGTGTSVFNHDFGISSAINSLILSVCTMNGFDLAFFCKVTFTGPGTPTTR